MFVMTSLIGTATIRIPTIMTSMIICGTMGTFWRFWGPLSPALMHHRQALMRLYLSHTSYHRRKIGTLQRPCNVSVPIAFQIWDLILSTLCDLSDLYILRRGNKIVTAMYCLCQARAVCRLRIKLFHVIKTYARAAHTVSYLTRADGLRSVNKSRLAGSETANEAKTSQSYHSQDTQLN